MERGKGGYNPAMSDLGDLLELMHTTQSRYSNVRAVVDEWSKPRVWKASTERYATIRPPQPGFHVHLSLTHDRQRALPETKDCNYRIWHVRDGDLWRVEILEEGGRFRAKIAGERHAFWISDGKAPTLETRQPGRSFRWSGVGISADRFLEVLFNPGSLLGLVSLVVVGRETHAGRPSIAALLQFRPEVDLDDIDWPYADETRILVDAQYGVLLRLELFLDGQPFIRWQVNEIAFDETFPDSTFEP